MCYRVRFECVRVRFECVIESGLNVLDSQV